MDANTTRPDDGVSRRRFLQTTAVAGGLAGLGGTAGVRAQSQQPETITLNGKVAGWIGRSPDSIRGKANPTIELDAGTKYKITWKNVDGKPHNIVISNRSGGTMKRTEVITKQGATQSVTFTATPKTGSYVCEVHPTTMVGEFDLGEDAAASSEGSVSNEDLYFPKGPSVKFETVVTEGPDSPLDFAVPPNTKNEYYIVDRSGLVYRYTEKLGLQPQPFIDVSDKLAEITGEMGLVGMAFHPNYQQNNKFYLRYSAPNREGTPDDYSHTAVLSEFTANADGTSADADSETTILEIPHPQEIHNAGQIAFGPDDGYLYTSMGDGGGGSDNNMGHVEDWYDPLDGGNGQDVAQNLLGSVLRIDVDTQEGDKAYAIPDDNPLVGQDGLGEHYAWGLRNPWRMGFSNGELYVGDVGQNSYEEINHIKKGGNYGWNVREGAHCFEPRAKEAAELSEGSSCPTKTPDNVRGGEPLIDPIIEYPHAYKNRGVGSSVIGGYIYTNDTVPELTDKYVFGDFRKNIDIEEPSGSLFAATKKKNGDWSTEEVTISNGDDGRVGNFVLAIGRDNDGELYVLTTSDHDPGEGVGTVYRIVRDPANANGTTGNGTAANGTAGNVTAGNATAGNATAGNATTNGAGNATSTNGTTGSTAAAGNGSTAGGASNGSSGSNNASGGESTTGSGPGFGAVAAVSGLVLGAARFLRRRNDED